MSVKTNLFISVFLFVLLQGSLSLQAQTDERSSSAQDDYLQVLICHTNTILDVFQNDAMILCTRNEITLKITSNSKTGATTSVNGDKNIVYAPAAGFVGHDTLEYQVVCKSTVYEAKVFIIVVGCPDNIEGADCYGKPPVINWNIQKLMESPSQDIVCHYSVPLVGDIDNDGKTEIIVSARDQLVSSVFINQLFIFKVNGNSITRQQTLSVPYFNMINNCYSIANVDGGPYAALFLATSITNNTSANQGQLIKYVYNGTQYVESWKKPYTTSVTMESAQPMIVDFNNDGIPEVLVYDKVFNARTGDLLVDAGFLSDPTKGFGLGGHMVSGYSTWTPPVPHAYSSLMAITDIDSDGIPEVIGGNSVYKVHISNPTGTSGNSFTLYKQASTTGRTDIKDGATAIADMDGDGLIDVIVTAPLNSTTASLYIWNPRTGEILNTNVVDNLISYPSCGVSTAFVGNIDNDPKPEICLVIKHALMSYDYNPLTKQITKKWDRVVNDESGATTVSLFDFDQDGKNELVYRDQSFIRIINGADGVDKPNGTFVCYSSTGNEYPVIADINNDGAAEIIVTGSLTSSHLTGRVMVFAAKTAQDKWAPTRKVWNQYSYNAVNVNDNLTIPKIQMNPATFFPNNKQPFNGYLMQQTLLNTQGDTYWTLPNIAWSKEPELTINNNTALFEGCIINTGNATLQDPIYVTFYKNDTIVANIIALHTIQKTLSVGDTLCFSFSINNWSSFEPINSVWISVNDRNGVYPYQTQCEVDGRFEIVLKKEPANNDYMQVLTCQTNTILDVFQNDAMILCTRNEITLKITSNSKTGATTSVNGDKNIVYAPAAGFVGHDTLEYQVGCKGTVYVAKVFIIVVGCPDNIEGADCYGKPPVINWNIQKLMESPSQDLVCNYSVPLVGDIDNDGKTEIIVPARNYSDPTVFINQMFIFEVNGNSITRQQTLSVPYFNMANNSYSIANVDGGPYAALFLATSITNNTSANQGQLIKYVYNGTQYVESWKKLYTTSVTMESAQPMIVDFNNDGIPEVLVYDKVFNARTGDLLVDAGFLSDPTKGFGLGGHIVSGLSVWVPAVPHAYASLMAITDIDSDGIPEVIGGNSVYKVHISNPTGTNGNSFTLYKQASTTGRTDIKDGATAIADMDGDGLIDVIVTAPLNATKSSLYIWNPRTGEILNTNVVDNLTPHPEYSVSTAFVGNIDNDPEPEICLVVVDALLSYDYNASTKQITKKWDRVVNDESGATTVSLFDFDQDGKNELVYRDQSFIRIINGADGVDKPNGTFVCYSSTANEYPVIADINNDGAAEIIVTGSLTTSPSPGRVMVFAAKTAQDKWAPTRKVWNQYSYNAVNVNDNLTIPKIQMNPATFFLNNKQPFNGYLMQQTLLNTQGDTYWTLPNIAWSKEPELTINNNTALFEGCIKNTGNATLQDPIYVTFYKNDTIVANIIALHTIQKTLSVGNTLCFSFSINNWSSFEPINSVWISVNDRNGVYPYQNQCEVDGRRKLVIDSSLFHVNVEVNEPDYGSATGTGDYAADTKAQVEAFVYNCYRFANWTIDSVVVSKENPYIFTVTQNVNIVANFYALDFDTYCPTLWENTFMLNLKLLRDEGYEVSGCKWFKNGIELTKTNTINEFSYSAGPNQGDLLELAPTYYTFELLTDNFGPLCSTKKTLTGSRVDKLIVYPNPVTAGAPLTITGATKDAPINVYNLFGICVKTAMGNEGVVKLTLDLPSGIYFVRSDNKVVKVVVMK